MSDLTVVEAKTMKASEIAPRLLEQKISEEDLLQFLLNLKAETGDDKLSMAVLKQEPLKWGVVKIRFMEQQGAFKNSIPSTAGVNLPAGTDELAALLGVGAAATAAWGAQIAGGKTFVAKVQLMSSEMAEQLKAKLGKKYEVLIISTGLIAREIVNPNNAVRVAISWNGQQSCVTIGGIELSSKLNAIKSAGTGALRQIIAGKGTSAGDDLLSTLLETATDSVTEGTLVAIVQDFITTFVRSEESAMQDLKTHIERVSKQITALEVDIATCDYCGQNVVNGKCPQGHPDESAQAKAQLENLRAELAELKTKK